MARLIFPKFGDLPQNDGEKRTIKFLLENLTPQGDIRNLDNWNSFGNEYVIIPNLEIPNKNRFLEVDVILITPEIVFVIEVKDWKRKIFGNDKEWILDNNKIVPNPLTLNNYKAKVLISLIQRNIPYLKKPSIQSILVIPNNDSILYLEGDCKNLTFRLDSSLIQTIKNPIQFLKENNKNHNYHKELVNVITYKTKANDNKTKYIEDYEIIEELNINDDFSEYICKETGALATKTLSKLRVFNLPFFDSKDIESEFYNKITRNRNSISSIGNHPNILPYRNIFKYESDKFVEVQDYSEEGTLRTAIYRKENPLTFNQIIEIIKGLASGLNAIHEKLIVHRDLRPENIVMVNLEPQIMNFYLAHIHNEKTVWKDITTDKDRKYLPFELSLDSDNYDFNNSSDLYSLGVITYELFCKKVPFNSPEELDLAGGKIPEDLLPSNIDPTIPKWIDNLIRKTYTLNIEDRFSSAKEFIQEIDNNLSKKLTLSNSYNELGRTFKENEIVGDYKILELIKTGGFAQVYRAIHRLQNIEYALKVNNIDVPLSSLIDEFYILNQLSHPNIVKVTWSGELIPERPYIAMEYIKGVDLTSFISSSNSIDLDTFFTLGKNILKALRYLHEKEQKVGIWKDKTLYHRDIKPENIIFNNDRGFILIDFNISKDSLDNYSFSGTRAYMAPDLLIGDNIVWNDSGDTFALGVTLYEVLYKKHPYPNKQPRISIQPNIPEFSSENTLLKLIAEFLVKSVQPKSDLRFKTAQEMEMEFLDIVKFSENIILENSKKETLSKIDFNNKNIRLINYPQEDFIEFKLKDEKEYINTDFWEKFTDKEVHSQVVLLLELIDNGQGIKKEDSIFIPYEELDLLNSIDLKLLNLPEFYPFKIRIESDGTINDLDFKYNWGFYEYELSKKLKFERIGGLIKSDDTSYLLNIEQLKLCNALDNFNKLDKAKKTSNSNFLAFAKIKNIALNSRTNSILDEYLKNENVIISKTIDLKLKLNEDESLEILPEVDIEDKSQFDKKFDKFPKVQETYNLENPDGNRLRVLFDEEQINELKKVKFHRKIVGEDKDKLVQFPQEIFNPDIIDLDKFSERVKEIGLYKPKFYPFISPYKSEWIPGFLIETSPENRVKVQFNNFEELNSFKHEFTQAKEENKLFFNWEENKIPIIEAPEIIEVAEKQLLNPSKPIDTKSISDKRVLIIKENIEDLEHTEDEGKDNKDKNSFIHRYTEPASLKKHISILEHQKEGIAWLQSLYSDNYSGALLADDMGLGKTLQLLSFIKWHNSFNYNDNKPYLIVAPVSLLENWENEYLRFFDVDGLDLLKGYGDSLKNILSIENLQKKQIFLTTYETIRNKQFILCSVDWSIVILDEAQKVKTPGTLITNAVKALKADFKISSTGTPVENTLVDLWCIMDFSVPGLLGSAKDFSKNFQNPLKSEDTDIKSLGENLRSQIGIYIKRRMKTDILKDLPKKYIEPLSKKMPPEQESAYLEEINKSKNLSVNGLEKNSILKILHNIRDISDHPYLISKNISDFDSDTLISSSAKLQLTIEKIREIKKLSEKVIIFTEKKETQRLLAKVIFDIFDINVKIINGDTPASSNLLKSSKESRQQAIDKFQMVEGFNIIIMSPISTGFGLNVTKANNVIHYSRHWNPAKEEQATDRVYRIGQSKDVKVYIPMSTLEELETFDIIIDKLLSRKRTLASSSLFPTERADISQEELYNEILLKKNKQQTEFTE